MNTEFKLTKIQFSISMILSLVFCVTGFTFAYFAFTAENTATISGEAATVNLTLDVTKVFPVSSTTNTGVMVPQLSTSGSNTSPLSVALKNGCVDANNNVVCQVYKVLVKNDGGTAAQITDGMISFYKDSAMTTDVSSYIPNLRWKLVDSVNATTPSNSVLGTQADLIANFDENIFADDVVLVTNAEKTYYIIVWLNETGEAQNVDPGNSFYGKIEFRSSNGTGVTSLFTA